MVFRMMFKYNIYHMLVYEMDNIKYILWNNNYYFQKGSFHQGRGLLSESEPSL